MGMGVRVQVSVLALGLVVLVVATMGIVTRQRVMTFTDRASSDVRVLNDQDLDHVASSVLNSVSSLAVVDQQVQ